jgi:hypothetical protein
MTRGVTEENSDIDMIPQEVGKQYSIINTYLETVKPKMVTFSIDKHAPVEKHGKMLKVMFRATVYSENGKPVNFRLVRVKGEKVIRGSDIQTSNTKPTEYTLYLPVGDEDDRVQLKEHQYYCVCKYVQLWSRPVLRRFSLSEVYV